MDTNYENFQVQSAFREKNIFLTSRCLALLHNVYGILINLTHILSTIYFYELIKFSIISCNIVNLAKFILGYHSPQTLVLITYLYLNNFLYASLIL